MKTKVKGPLEGFYYAHEVVRTELANLSDLAEKLNPGNNIDDFEKRVDNLHYYVGVHAKGEEEAFYPYLDKKYINISKAYLWDHELDEELFSSINKNIAKSKSSKNNSDIESLRKDVFTLKATLSAHAQKEDDLLVPLAADVLSPEEQGAIISKVAEHIEPQKMGDVIKLFAQSLSTEDKIAWIKIVKDGLPLEVFQEMAGLIQQSISGKEWQDIQQAVPELR